MKQEISILIPVFNFDVRPLVIDLQGQCINLGIQFEIILMDDGSAQEFIQLNRPLQDMEGIRFIILEKGVGRSRIRNKLAASAAFNTLLFIDCDMLITKADYIEHYLKAAVDNMVICGGRVYSETPPVKPEKYFHWKYGKGREVKSVAQRRKQPYKAFLTDNFVIDASVFNEIRFDDSLMQYGHEDTLFGIELKRKAIHVEHIDNPMLHSKLENFDIFFHKTDLALENLKMIYNRFEDKKLLQEEVRLLEYFKKMEDKGIASFLKFSAPLICPLLMSALKNKSADLRLFDLYKLVKLCAI